MLSRQLVRLREKAFGRDSEKLCLIGRSVMIEQRCFATLSEAKQPLVFGLGHLVPLFLEIKIRERGRTVGPAVESIHMVGKFV